MRIMQCWDDGDVDDIRLVDILKKHGARATFNINPGGWKSERRMAHRFKGEYPVYRLTLDEMPQVYEGFCIGGGLATALAADLRFATPDARFGIPAARLGLGYEYEGIAKLARIVGPSRARDILFSARFMEAQEARDMGLVNAIVDRGDIEEEVAEYARRISANAPLTLKAAKAALNAWERGGREADLDHVRNLVDACFDSDDYREGRRAFREKRPPVFRGR